MTFTLKIPLLGFESLKEMKLTKIDDIFMQLENVADAGVPSLTLINPFALKPYGIEIPDAIEKALDITSSSNVLIYNIVVIHTPIEKSTVNFVAPLIFNADNNTMAQTILDASQTKEHKMAECISDFLTESER